MSEGAAQGGDNGDCDTSFVPSTGSVATDDIASWENALDCLLPNAEREIQVNNNTVIVSVDWDQIDTTLGPVAIQTEI
ncbi:hypothetical protein CF392_16120 [Tamilnaduibacter salinus]|uniref:Uncharacterized protein n=1 Tax=Tamilnaduibacter salinus TaxID=1484056 RepID=A0A2A2HZK8_9GAMM|nr:hypothetical protein CF392_16120 [Tamilnaduibacter salinus]